MQSTCDLYDAHLDLISVLPAGLVHFGGRPAFHGRAVTVKCFEDNSRIRELAQAEGHGRVMVVDAGGSMRCAVLGDMIAGAALKSGWAGIIIWGCIRDRALLAELGLGVMALGATPRRSVRNGEGQTGLVVSLGGTVVAQDDYVVADADGVVIFPAAGPLPEGAWGAI